MECRRILVMDGSADIRRLNKTVLSRKIKNCEVLEAGTLAEGRLLVRTDRPDLIILEAEMPDGSGFDFARELRELGIPVLFVTELDSLPDIRTGFDLGRGEYLTKPYSVNMMAYRAEALLRAAD